MFDGDVKDDVVAMFDDDAKFDDDVKVDGDVKVDDDFKVDGDIKLDGNIKVDVDVSSVTTRCGSYEMCLLLPEELGADKVVMFSVATGVLFVFDLVDVAGDDDVDVVIFVSVVSAPDFIANGVVFNFVIVVFATEMFVEASGAVVFVLVDIIPMFVAVTGAVAVPVVVPLVVVVITVADAVPVVVPFVVIVISGSFFFIIFLRSS